MSTSCPLNFIKVDATIARFVSFLISSLVGVYLYTHNVWILYFLVFDFLVRLFFNPEFSILYMLARVLKSILKIESSFTDGGAKKLAAFFGLFFVFLLIVSEYLGVWSLSFGIAIVFLSCSLLDVFFNFCIGCKIYYIIKKIYPNFMNNL